MPSIYMVLDTRRIKQSGTFPVKLRVTLEKKTTDFQTVFDLSSVDYDLLTERHISAKLKEIRDKLQNLESAAKIYADTLDPFTFSEFELGFVQASPLFKPRKLKKEAALETSSGEFDYGPYLKKFPILQEQHLHADSISVIYVSIVRAMIREGRIGSALNYQISYMLLRKFRGNRRFKEITVSYLREFEKMQVSAGNSKAYVGMLLRHLRAVFNAASNVKLIHKERCYPFGKGKYIIPSKKKIKDPLEQEQIGEIYYADFDDEGLLESIDYWMFMFLGNGMNGKDLVRLTYQKWVGDTLRFERAKTENTAREDPITIIVHVNEDILRIIETRGNKDRSPDNYIFPILRKDMNPLEEHVAIRKFNRLIRDRMIRVCKILGISHKSNPQQARYAFLNHMRNAGAPISLTKEMAGHEHQQTTESYYSPYKDPVKVAYAKTLTAFKGTGRGVQRKRKKGDRYADKKAVGLSASTQPAIPSWPGLTKEKAAVLALVKDPTSQWIVYRELEEIEAFVASSYLPYDQFEMGIYEQMGFVLLPDTITREGAVLKMQATLPTGWTRQLNTTRDWRIDILDARGRLRIDLHYKPWERLYATFHPRFEIRHAEDYQGGPTCIKMVIWDNDNKSVFRETGPVDEGQYALSRQKAQWELEKLLDSNLPEWRSPLAYWS